MEERESEGSAQRQRYPGIEGTKERLGVLYMDMEDSAGGARKATKSKLFEFLVHGVVSERERACLCMWKRVSGSAHSRTKMQRLLSVHLYVNCLKKKQEQPWRTECRRKSERLLSLTYGGG